MGVSTYGTNHPLAVKLWSRKLFYEVFKETWVSKFMGTDSNSMIQIKDEANKGPGDKITVGLRMLLTGGGVQGDGTLEGNEEALTLYNDAVYIDQLRHATRSGGKMSEQRVPFEVREENRMALKDWWTERIETWAANQLAGNTGQADTRYTGNQAAIAPSTGGIGNWIISDPSAGISTELSITATTSFALTLTDIDKCVARAKTASPKIRPIRINGGDYYVMFLHPYQVYQLRNDTSASNSWVTLQRQAMTGGEVTNSPLFTGAIGMYNNVILHEWSYLPTALTVSGIAANKVRRAVFCGAQAAVLAYGQDNQPNQMSWTEELFDYGNQLGVSAGMIAGLKKTQFNSLDFGTIVVSSYAPTI